MRYRSQALKVCVCAAAFLVCSTISSGQNPSFNNPDSSKHNSVRMENFKKKEEERQKEELAKKTQAMEAERSIASGILPAVTAIREFPSSTPAFITDSLDAYIQRGMQQWQIPGLAITIVKDGKVIFSKGYGVTELGRTVPVD